MLKSEQAWSDEVRSGQNKVTSDQVKSDLVTFMSGQEKVMMGQIRSY